MQTPSDKKEIKKPETSFTSGNLPKAMMKFSVPYMLGILVQNLYGAVDLFVVGHFAETADVSAVTVGSQLMAIATQLIIGLATGITMLIGQSFGAGDKKRLSKTTGVSILLFGIAGVVLTAVYLVFSGAMISAMNTPAEAVAPAREYLIACSFGIIFIVGYNVVTSILTGLGDSKTPFIFILVACVINVVLDVILVKYVHMGALGAAIATSVAQAGSFIFSVLFIRRRGLGFPISKSDIKLDSSQTWKIARIGTPVAIQNTMVNISFLFITAIINQMGLHASAAVGVVEKLVTFLFVPAIAFGTAVGTASSQNIGAGNGRRAKSSMWWGILLALVPSIIITIICQLQGELLAGILNTNKEVISLAANYLKSYVFDVVMVSFVFCMNGYFNSSGKSWFSMLHSLISTFAVRIPLAYVFSRLENTNLYTIGWAAPLSTLVSLVLCFVFLFIFSNKKQGEKSPEKI